MSGVTCIRYRVQLVITSITAAKFQPWFSSVSGAYQAAIANAYSFFRPKTPLKNKKLTGMYYSKTQLWKREETFSQTVNFN